MLLEATVNLFSFVVVILSTYEGYFDRHCFGVMFI